MVAGCGFPYPARVSSETTSFSPLPSGERGESEEEKGKDMEQRSGRGLKFTAAAVALCGVSALAATGLAYVLRPVQPELGGAVPAAPKSSSATFQGWPRPDLVLLVSGEQHGYLLPCGCSRPQYGGLERRYNFLQQLRQKGWPVAALDLGDVPQAEGPRKLPNIQGLIKYRYALESMKEMGYLAVGLGRYEAGLSLFSVLGEYALNNPVPRVLAANLRDKQNQPLSYFEVKPSLLTQPGGSPLKLGVTSLAGPSVQDVIKDPNIKFEANPKVVPGLLRQLQGADLRVLLYQGTVKEAKALAGAVRDFHVIQCLSPEDEPRSDPEWVGNTMIVATGHKARYVGVIGIWRGRGQGRPFEMRYQLVSLGEEYLTPRSEAARHPILTRLERYQQELMRENYLGKYVQRKHPNQLAVPGAVPTYVGTEKCKKCHESAYTVWEKSRHSHAYADLVAKSPPPGLRQFDAECIVCHTVGFGFESGYKTEKDTPHLKNVGCESCHGPASEHVKQPRNPAWHAVMNPWKAKAGESAEQKAQRQLRIDKFCSECHDIDNDVHFKFEKRWPAIAHPSFVE